MHLKIFIIVVCNITILIGIVMNQLGMKKNTNNNTFDD